MRNILKFHWELFLAGTPLGALGSINITLVFLLTTKYAFLYFEITVNSQLVNLQSQKRHLMIIFAFLFCSNAPSCGAGLKKRHLVVANFSP